MKCEGPNCNRDANMVGETLSGRVMVLCDSCASSKGRDVDIWEWDMYLQRVQDIASYMGALITESEAEYVVETCKRRIQDCVGELVGDIAMEVRRWR